VTTQPFHQPSLATIMSDQGFLYFVLNCLESVKSKNRQKRLVDGHLGGLQLSDTVNRYQTEVAVVRRDCHTVIPMHQSYSPS